MPLPTSGGSVQNLLSTGNEVNPMNQFSLKLDHRFGVSDTLYGRVTSFRVHDTQPFGTTSLSEALVPGFGRTVTTDSENVALGYTHAFGSSWLNEVRFGYLHASGGQVSPNQGVNFAAPSGLQGVTQNARDMGYPQVSFGGLFSAIGDPTSFVSRDDRSYELYDNVMFDRGAHHLKFGGYLFRLEFNPVNPTNARGNFTFNGQWTGNAFADFLLGYPSASQVGIGRADEHGRSTWFHVYGQDDWKINSNLTLNYGLRYEINSQMSDVDNRLSAIDIPDRRFVIASDDSGNVSPSATPLLSQIPIPYVTSQEAGWTQGLLRPSYLRFAPRVGVVWAIGNDQKTVVNAGFGVFLNQWAYSVQQALAQTLPFFFAKTVTAASDAVQPTQQTSTVLLRPANGTIGGNTMNWELPDRIREELLRVRPAPGHADDDVRGELPAFGDRGRRQLHRPERAGARSRRHRSPPSGPSVEQHHGDSVGRLLDLQRRHLPRRAAAVARAGLHGPLHAVEGDRRCVRSRRHGVTRPTCRRTCATWPPKRPRASFDHRHRFVGNLTYALPNFGGRGAGCSRSSAPAGRSTASSCSSRARPSP